MEFGYVYVSLFMCSLFKFGRSEITCGHLKVVYDYKATSIDCRIRLYPSIELQTVIVDSHFYRWILTKNVSASATTSEIILQKNSGTYNKTKYNEDNFTLLIRNLTPLDVGRYEVECWSSRNVFYRTDKVKVVIPDRPTVSPGSTPLVSSSQDEGIGETTIIVISICVVVIVAIVSGTIYLIIGKQRGGILGVKRLVSNEGTSALGHVRHSYNEDPSSIYNEIDAGEMVLDYAKVDKMHSKPIHEPFKDVSVAVQSCSGKKVTMTTDEDDYDLVNINDALVRDTDDMEVEYADIIVELPTETTNAIEAAEGHMSYTYVTVAANDEQENDKETIVIVPESSKPNINHELQDEDINTNVHDNDTQAPTYAKVSKKKQKSNETNTIESQSLCDVDYSVQFPDINYSEITRSLDDGCHDQQDAQRLKEPAMYSNLVSRPQRDKTRLSRASRRELQYAVLDLPDQDSSASFLHGGHQVKGHTKLQSCCYDDIDFERKAFVAPIRKAPSSWFRRKKKGGKKNNS